MNSKETGASRRQRKPNVSKEESKLEGNWMKGRRNTSGRDDEWKGGHSTHEEGSIVVRIKPENKGSATTGEEGKRTRRARGTWGRGRGHEEGYEALQTKGWWRSDMRRGVGVRSLDRTAGMEDERGAWNEANKGSTRQFGALGS